MIGEIYVFTTKTIFNKVIVFNQDLLTYIKILIHYSVNLIFLVREVFMKAIMKRGKFRMSADKTNPVTLKLTIPQRG